MPKKLAIDWDDTELRLVAAQCGGSGVKVTDAAVIPMEDGNIEETLSAAIERRGLEKLETLVAIGRGRAELRELKLPPVPDEELPDMVRFQAIRSFASAGDSASVDFLVTQRTDETVKVIAAAIAPSKFDFIRKPCESAHLHLKRIALRPLSAAALYLTRHEHEEGETVLIDLLGDDAEIVITRDGKVLFVRTVRLPGEAAARPAALAGELRRSLVACGSTQSSRRVLLWGRQAIHREDTEGIAKAIGGEVNTLDPFELVDVESKIQPEIPDHTGRLAPLVGLLASDDAHPDRLVDFLNPRKRPEAGSQVWKTAAFVGVPVVAALLLGWFGYRELAAREATIARLEQRTRDLQPEVEEAEQKVERTETVDAFLDGDVNWLRELRRIAEKVPPADKVILQSVSGRGSDRRQLAGNRASGGGEVTLKGSVTRLSVIETMEQALRDEDHVVTAQGTNKQATEDAYQYDFTETIFISPGTVRERRYAGLDRTRQPDESASDSPAGGTAGKSGDAGQPNETGERELERKDGEENDDAEKDDAETGGGEVKPPVENQTAGGSAEGARS